MYFYSLQQCLKCPLRRSGLYDLYVPSALSWLYGPGIAILPYNGPIYIEQLQFLNENNNQCFCIYPLVFASSSFRIVSVPFIVTSITSNFVTFFFYFCFVYNHAFVGLPHLTSPHQNPLVKLYCHLSQLSSVV